MRISLASDLDPRAEDAANGFLARLLEGRSHAGLDGQAWSLSEALLCDRDYTWLLKWAECQTPSSINADSKRCAAQPGDTAVGAALWALFAEHLRRHGSEGNFWSELCGLPWDPRVRYLLLGERGIPSGLAKGILRRSVGVLGLRSVIGSRHTQSWLGTAFLQFGFTRLGMERHLPDWLRGQSQPLAVQHLLGQKGPKTSSRSFQELWGRIVALRKEEGDEGSFRSFLASSPWILPEWIEPLILRLKDERTFPRKLTQVDAHSSRRFVESPRLVWPNGKSPTFAIAWADHRHLNLADKAYVLKWADSDIGRIVRQPDGRYAPTSHLPMELGLLPSQGVAKLVSAESGELVASETLVLWDGLELVNLFSPRGLRQDDAYQARSETHDVWMLRVPAFAEVRGTPAEVWRAEEGDRFIRVGEVYPVSVWVQGHEVWSSDSVCAGALDLDSLEILVRWHQFPKLPICFDPEAIGIGATLEVAVGPGYEISWAYWNMRPMKPQGQSGLFFVVLRPDDLFQAGTVAFGFRVNGTTAVLSRKLDIPCGGLAWRRKNRTSILASIETLTVHAAQNDTFRIRLPGCDALAQVSDRWLIEAGAVAGRIPVPSGSLGQLAGVGGALVVRNHPADGACDVIIAKRVVDTGVVRSVATDESTIQVHLLEPLPEEGEHAVFVWNRRNEILRATPRQGRSRRTWVIPRDTRLGDILALGIFLNGTRLGSWFGLDHWPQAFLSVRSNAEAWRAATILRLFRAPILDSIHRTGLGDFIRKYAASVLSAWLREMDTLLCDYRFKGARLDKGWSHAAQKLLEHGGIALSAGDARELMREMTREHQLSLQAPPGRDAPRLALVQAAIEVQFLPSRSETTFQNMAANAALSPQERLAS